MRWLLFTVVACGVSGDPATPVQTSEPTSEPSTTGTGSLPATETPTETVSTGTFRSECACPEDFDPAAFDIVELDEDRLLTRVGGPVHDELVVFLHGSGQAPSNHTNILRTAAFAGYRVVGIKYPTQPGIDECRADYPDDLSWCVEELHRAKIYGEEHPGYIQIEDDRSIVGRLWATLRDAHALDPSAGWDAYFVDGDPATLTQHENNLNWDRMILGGFSQGTEHATMLSKDFQLDGLVLMSGPVDTYVEWIERPGQTPGCAVFAFRHDNETLAHMMDDNYDLLSFPGPLTDVEPLKAGTCDELDWPLYGATQTFASNLRPSDDPGCSNPDPSHGSMANDVCMNVADAVDGDPYALFRVYLSAFCRVGHIDPDGAGGCTDPWAVASTGSTAPGGTGTP